MSKMYKLLYADDTKNIAVKGEIISEDEFFINFLTIRGDIFRIGKRSIISIKELVGV